MKCGLWEPYRCPTCVEYRFEYVYSCSTCTYQQLRVCIQLRYVHKPAVCHSASKPFALWRLQIEQMTTIDYSVGKCLVGQEADLSSVLPVLCKESLHPVTVWPCSYWYTLANKVTIQRDIPRGFIAVFYQPLHRTDSMGRTHRWLFPLIISLNSKIQSLWWCMSWPHTVHVVCAAIPWSPIFQSRRLVTTAVLMMCISG